MSEAYVDEQRSASVLETRIWGILDEIKDPEMPWISLVELGLIHQIELVNARLHIKMIPTFVGCPALEMMRLQVMSNLSKVHGLEDVFVEFVMDVPWTSDRISEAGRQKLLQAGIAPPPQEFNPRVAPACTYCGADATHVVSLFGPASCRSVYYCTNCKQPFEGIKFM